MPSPFPGMDPYLENPSRWPDFHLEFLSALKQLLNERLLPRYYAVAEDRVYVSHEDDTGRQLYVADVAVHEKSPQAMQPSSSHVVAAPIETVTMLDEEVHNHYLAVYDKEHNQVVTVIEVLSPTNKLVGSDGFYSYRRKRTELQHAATNLVEIDLLRSGAKALAIPPITESDYYVHVSKHWARPRGSIWPIQLSQVLPEISVPLTQAEPEVPLDLQRALNMVYERSRYEAVIDYQRDPVPPLSEQDAHWADELLRTKGLRA